MSSSNHSGRGDYNTEALIFKMDAESDFLMFLKKKQVK